MDRKRFKIISDERGQVQLGVLVIVVIIIIFAFSLGHTLGSNYYQTELNRQRILIEQLQNETTDLQIRLTESQIKYSKLEIEKSELKKNISSLKESYEDLNRTYTQRIQTLERELEIRSTPTPFHIFIFRTLLFTDITIAGYTLKSIFLVIPISLALLKVEVRMSLSDWFYSSLILVIVLYTISKLT